MNNEQRALATLDLALKNAFETLNKYSLWVRTPEDSVTFNLVDALPTLESNGTGIFLKPITVPSFSAVRSTIFGTQGTTSERPLYWNLRFKAVNGWIFEKNVADNPTKLTVLVDTFFGANEFPIAITNTNVTENLISSQLLLDENSVIDFNNGTLRLDSGSFKANLDNVSIGVSDGKSVILGSNVVIGRVDAPAAFTYEYSRNSLNVETNTIILGPADIANPKQSTYSTIIRSGSMEIDLTEGKNFQMKMRNSSGSKSLFSAVYNNGGYDIYLIENGFKANRLYIGDVKNLKVTASDSLELANEYGSLIFTKAASSLFGDVLKISSETSTSIGSKTRVNIGIEDSSGNISNEIVVTKGSVVIPNLYVQKKANYQLSGVKHVTPSYENPSVKYVPNSLGKTTSTTYCAYEYTKDIANTLYESDSSEYFDTTFNNLSGSLISYMVKLENSNLKVYKAPVASDGGSGYIISGEYEEDTNITGDILDSTPYAYDPSIKAFSTSNGMYVMVREFELVGRIKYAIYFSSNGTKFDQIAEYTLNATTAYDISVDYVSRGSTDHVWFALSYSAYNGRLWTSDLTQSYTYNVYYLENDCITEGGVTTSKIEPLNSMGAYQVSTSANPYSGDWNSYYYWNRGASDIAYDMVNSLQFVDQSTDSFGQYALVGNTCKIAVVDDESTRPYALIMNAFACSYDFHKNAHAMVIMQYAFDGSKITQSEKAFARNDAIPNGKIIDFVWNNDSNNGYGLYATRSEIKKYRLTGSNALYLDGTINYKTRLVSKLMATISDDSRHVIRSICNSSGTAAIELDETLNNFSSFTDLKDAGSKNSHIISTLGFMYYDNITNSIKYFDNGSGGITISQIAYLIETGKLPVKYDVDGFIVDYLGLNVGEDGYFFNSFVLSKNDVDPYKILNADTSIDRGHYVEAYNGDITTLIQSSEFVFTPSKISSELQISYDSATSIFVRMSNIYDPAGKFTEKDPSVNANELVRDALNFHLEPISYLAKNRKNYPSEIAIGGCTITKLSNTLYSISSKNNKYSGYRIPYYYTNNENVLFASESQLNFSNASESSARLSDLHASLMNVYVTLNDATLTVHSAQNIGESIISVTIPYQLIDPTDASYDPISGIVNEFNNVVSIKLPYLFGFRARCCNTGAGYDGRSNIVFGLTEVADIGEVC